MYFRGIGTAAPTARCTKAECLAAFQRSEWYARVGTHASLIARTELQRDNGIEAGEIGAIIVSTCTGYL